MSQSHMVTFQAPDGSSEFRRFDSIDQVVTFVEDLRNTSGVDDAKIYRLEEVRFEFRPYYRVQMAPGAAPTAGRDRLISAGDGSRGATVSPVAPPTPPVSSPAEADPQFAPAAPERVQPSPVASEPAMSPPVLTAVTEVVQAPPVPGPEVTATGDLTERVELAPAFTDEGFRPESSPAATELGASPQLSAVLVSDDASISADPSTTIASAGVPSPGPDSDPTEDSASAAELDSSAQRFTSTAFGIDPPSTTRRGLFGR